MKIEQVKISELKQYLLNSKLHPPEQIEGIAESIRQHGFYTLVLIDSANNIIAGHGRVQAAQLAGLKTVPCLRKDNLTEEQVKALRLYDNRIAETGWDLQSLKLDLEELKFDFKPFNIEFETLFPAIDLEPESDSKEKDPDEDETGFFIPLSAKELDFIKNEFTRIQSDTNAPTFAHVLFELLGTNREEFNQV